MVYRKAHRRCFGSGGAAAMALRATCSGIINTRSHTHEASQNSWPTSRASIKAPPHYSRSIPEFLANFQNFHQGTTTLLTLQWNRSLCIEVHKATHPATVSATFCE